MQTVRRREDVAEACAKPATAATATPTTAAAKKAIPSSLASQRKVVAAPVPSTSAWSALPTSAGGTASTPFDMGGVSDGSFYCDYCNVFCNSESQLDAHCASAKHKLNISSDREHQWNYRPPPLTVADGQYTVCPRCAVFCTVNIYSIINSTVFMSDFVLHYSCEYPTENEMSHIVTSFLNRSLLHVT